MADMEKGTGGAARKLGKPQIIGICAAAAVIVIGVIIFFATRGQEDMIASTIRFLRMQGTVNLLDASDKTVSIIDNMRLEDGNKVLTFFSALSARCFMLQAQSFSIFVSATSKHPSNAVAT